MAQTPQPPQKTTAATSVAGSEWGECITEGLAETTTPHKQIYVFGKRRWVEPSRKWREPAS